MAVDCRDHGVGSARAYQHELEKYPRWSGYTRDLWRFQSCHFLTSNEPGNSLALTFPSVPALILAGELDPITPVEWAEAMHQQWPQSQFHAVPDTGHAVINSDDCVYHSLRTFLDSPEEKVSFCGNRNRERKTEQ
jgi:pimeloyl-ACP methyl ester carboxylesterase